MDTLITISSILGFAVMVLGALSPFVVFLPSTLAQNYPVIIKVAKALDTSVKLLIGNLQKNLEKKSPLEKK